MEEYSTGNKIPNLSFFEFLISIPIMLNVLKFVSYLDPDPDLIHLRVLHEGGLLLLFAFNHSNFYIIH